MSDDVDASGNAGSVVDLHPGWVAGLGVCGNCGEYRVTVAPAAKLTKLECGNCGEWCVAVIPLEGRKLSGEVEP